jgi:hypothetical protein
MRDLTDEIYFATATVPIADIQQSRRDFPDQQISFSLELTCSGFAGMAALCRVLADAGLALQNLKAGVGGTVYCMLLDDKRADLSRLTNDFGPLVTLDRWTIEVAF